MPPQKINNALSTEFIDKYDTFMFDCDGVIWLAETAIPGAVNAVNRLASLGKRVLFVTNNSARSRQSYLKKFDSLGFKGVQLDSIWPTCYSAAMILKHTLKIPLGSKVWVLGEAGIEQELEQLGYVSRGGTDPILDQEYKPDHPLFEVDPGVKAVVVGSTKKLNYMRVALTLQYLVKREIPFIGTNIDRTFPCANGMVLPAGGSVVNNMAFTSDREFLHAGKPLCEFFDLIAKTMSEPALEKTRTLMIGDTLYTDIKFGNDNGVDTLLVLSGGSSLEDMQNAVDGMVPSYYMDSIASFV